MTRFELFCMIFYTLDAEWEETRDDRLANFLSDMNPFLFSDCGSAVPSVYADFCEIVTDTVTVENSHQLAKKYLFSLNKEYIIKAFEKVSQDEWKNAVMEYLSNPHKS